MRADVCMGLICCCGRLLNSTDLHGLSCYLNVGCFICHIELNLILKRSLAQVNIRSILQPFGFSRYNRNTWQLYLYLLVARQNFIWYVTVSDSFAFLSHLGCCGQGEIQFLQPRTIKSSTTIICQSTTFSILGLSKCLVGLDHYLRDSCVYWLHSLQR